MARPRTKSGIFAEFFGNSKASGTARIWTTVSRREHRAPNFARSRVILTRERAGSAPRISPPALDRHRLQSAILLRGRLGVQDAVETRSAHNAERRNAFFLRLSSTPGFGALRALASLSFFAAGRAISPSSGSCAAPARRHFLRYRHVVGGSGSCPPGQPHLPELDPPAIFFERCIRHGHEACASHRIEQVFKSTPVQWARRESLRV